MSVTRLAALLPILAGASALGGCTHLDDMLPPVVASQFPVYHFAGFGEPPLWRPQAARGYRTRIRLSIDGIWMRKASIGIDEFADGGLRGRVVYVVKDGLPDDRSIRTFHVSRAAFDSLQRAIARTRLWTLYPEFWGSPGGDICIDGMELMFERVDARGYRFSTANAQCTAPEEMLEIAAEIIRMSGDPSMLKWLD